MNTHFAGLLLLCAIWGSAHANTMTFEGITPPGELTLAITPYVEDGFRLTTTNDSDGVVSVTSPFNTAGFSSDCFVWDTKMPLPQLTLAEVDGNPFTLKSIEIGKSGTSAEPDTDITITGFLAGGGSISQQYENVSAATVVMPAGFENLTSLRIMSLGGDAAIDNISVNTAAPCASDIATSKGPGADGSVNLFDLLLLLDNWGTSGAGAAISADGGGIAVVDLFDLLAMLDAWGDCP